MHDHLPKIAAVVAKFASVVLFPPLRFFKVHFMRDIPNCVYLKLVETEASSA